jgi:hypothetical protein
MRGISFMLEGMPEDENISRTIAAKKGRPRIVYGWGRQSVKSRNRARKIGEIRQRIGSFLDFP